ncbi:dephospho-CoA kinase [Gluconobacter albidus]|uniref:Dephospho-CoA kinase n=1 Tax=Gluconobacter albidus TaxID=318683 RepID=A0AAW3QXM0_9PROT|nr:dephospho-CoA kinase [Gluconobacter albidus]KXV37506.1 dephospho-CoA kinase [Gluconobacter albidus]GBQ92294.1 dephospho-CoA kinase [Gluconobacter albidus NBRC 3250]GLQ68184.1 dephospho-CoA kinase [Gluconobacter albidus]
MRIIGLTGGMAAGKSTVATLFRRAGVPVFDADACVRVLQGEEGKALPLIEKTFPGTVADGHLDRVALREVVRARPDALKRLEAIMHPLVRTEREHFLKQCRARKERFCVLDIPLLMEIGEDRRCDLVVVAQAPMNTRLARIRQRGRSGGRMSVADAKGLLARQINDHERRRRADIVIRTGLSRGHAARQVHALLHRLREAS